MKTDQLKFLAELALDEADLGEREHGPFNSLHEGMAVLWEEFEELKVEVFRGNTEPRNPRAIRAEAIQVAAVALKIARMVDGTNG